VVWYPYGIRLRDAAVRPFVVTRRAQVSTHAASPFDLGAGRAGSAETLPAETSGPALLSACDPRAATGNAVIRAIAPTRDLNRPGGAFLDGVTVTSIDTSYTRVASLI
jgi:hypothetical protein